MAHLQLRDSSPGDLFPMKYNMPITNFVEIYFVIKRNWILKTEWEKMNEENVMKLFQSTYSVLLCGVGTFDFQFITSTKSIPGERYVQTNSG